MYTRSQTALSDAQDRKNKMHIVPFCLNSLFFHYKGRLEAVQKSIYFKAVFIIKYKYSKCRKYYVNHLRDCRCVWPKNLLPWLIHKTHDSDAHNSAPVIVSMKDEFCHVTVAKYKDLATPDISSLDQLPS